MRPLRPADEKGLKKVYLAYLLLLNAHAVMNFAPQAIIPSSQQSAVFSDSPAIILVLSTADPKTHFFGSVQNEENDAGIITYPMHQIHPEKCRYKILHHIYACEILISECSQ